MTCGMNSSCGGHGHDASDSLPHSVTITECGKLSAVPWPWPPQEEFKPQVFAPCRQPRDMCWRRWWRAAEARALVYDARVMANHNAGPLAQWLSPSVEDQPRTVPTSREEREGSFRFRPLL